MKKKLIIIGIGETAKLAYEYFMYDSDYKPCAFAVSKKYKSMDFLYEIPVVNMEDLDQRYSMNEYEVFVAIGSGQLNTERERVYKYIKSLGFKLASYISSKSFIWQNVEIGENCFIMENVTIQPFAKLGNNIIMFPGSLVAHSSNICDNCFISSGCIVSG
ncbi:acetyltransferase, partial [Campylobacter jejuni]